MLGLVLAPSNAKETSMSVGGGPQNSSSRDFSLASINEAFRLIGQTGQRPERLDEPTLRRLDGPKKEGIETIGLAKPAASTPCWPGSQVGDRSIPFLLRRCR
jgi:hypothetical protein